MDKFPIIIPSEQVKARINSIVLDLMKLQKPYLIEEKTRIKQEINKLESDLNSIIYELYGLKQKEIEIVEGKS